MVLSAALAALLAARAAAAEVAVVFGGAGPLRAAAEAQAACLPAGTARVFELPDDERRATEVLGEVRRERPAVVAAVGARAAGAVVRAFPQKPLVYQMVAFPERLGLTAREGAFGVAWLPSAAALARALKLLFGAGRIGVISSRPPRRAASLQEALARQGLELQQAGARSPADIPDALRALHGAGVAALWLGLDPVTADQDSYELIRGHALESRLPLVAPFALAPDSRAVAGLSASPQAAGEAACAMAAELLAGGEPARLVHVDHAELSVDLSVARRIGFAVPPDALKDAAKVLDR